MTKTRFLISTAAVLIAGCATVTPTREISQSYAVFDVKAGPETTNTKAAEALKTGLQKNMSAVQISHGIPPSPLPDKAPRFQLVSPFKGNAQMSALAAASAQTLQVPTCEGAIVTANGRDSSYARYGEATTFFACLIPYQGGWGLSIYTTFAKTSGAFNAATLGATLARQVTGDSSQFIPRTINDIVQALQSAGATVTLLEAYP